jgi:hypothetical protein
MALRWDLIKNLGNNIQEGVSGLANKILHVNTPTLPAVQMADNGEIDLQKSFEQSMAQPKTLKENLLGRTFTFNSEAKNPETGELEVSQVSKFQPGLLNDIRSGAKENFATGFAAPNWEQTKTPDGRNKGFGYRLGEGLGSFAKFAESPLGRGLIMAGIVGAAGGSGLEALGYGAGAGLANQQNRMKDKLYRDNLIRQRQEALKADKNFQLLDAEEQQAMLDAIAKEINSIRGYLGDTSYKNMVNAQIAQDNADYKRLYLDSQKKNQEVAEQLAKDKFEYTKQQDAIENERENRKLNIAEGKIQKGTQKFRTAIGDKDGALQQIQEMKALVKANPKATGYIVGKFAKGQEAGQKFANEFLSRNPEAIKTRAAIAKLRGTTMHDLAGTAQTLQEQRNLAPFLPDATDNAQTILAKLEQLEKELLREKQTLVNTGYELGLDYDNTQPAQQTTNNEGWAF